MKSSYASQSMLQYLNRFLFATSILVLTVACASSPPVPEDALNSARSGIDRAELADARQYAPTELDEAQRQLALAEAALGTQNMEQAERSAVQSLASAELAYARTELAKAVAVNREMILGLEALIEEMERTGDLQ